MGSQERRRQSRGLGTAQTFTAAQTMTNSLLRLLGSSTGYTQFTSANSGASNFTITVPALTTTLVTQGDTNTVALSIFESASGEHVAWQFQHFDRECDRIHDCEFTGEGVAGVFLFQNIDQHFGAPIRK